MNQPQHTRSSNRELVELQVSDRTPESIVELIARQLDRADEAHERIRREGSVVRDMKGSVIPHPAIAVEITATKLASDLLTKNKHGRTRGEV